MNFINQTDGSVKVCEKCIELGIICQGQLYVLDNFTLKADGRVCDSDHGSFEGTHAVLVYF